MRILFDAQVLKTYPFAQAGFSGGTEGYVKHIVSGLAERGHQVHVVASDLDHDEQRGPGEWWWGPENHPWKADVVIPVQNLQHVVGYTADHFVLLTTTNDPWLGADGSWGARLSAIPCMSQCHVDLLTKERPSIAKEKCVITGLGVEPIEESEPVPGRMFWANDPARGLWHLLDIFDLVRERIPEATLHIGYDFDQQFEHWRWQASDMAERMWQCKERIDRGDGITNCGALSREALLREQLECQVHVHPSDPPNIGSQTHGLTQMECAAAGAALVLSDIESFPELFSDCASLLPLPGMLAARNEDGEPERIRVQDWADEVVRIMESSANWNTMSARSREVAARHTWPGVLDRWETMLGALS